MSFRRELLPSPIDFYRDIAGLDLEGKGEWRTTSCVFHGGSDSMRVMVTSGGFRCMNCSEKGGDVLAYHMKANDLEFIDAAKALGAWVNDGKPENRSKPSPLSPRQALELLGTEIHLAAIVVTDMAKGKTPSAKDAARLRVCAQRVNFVREALKC